MRLKFYKQSAVKFVVELIPTKSEGQMPHCFAADYGSGFSLGFIAVIEMDL
jgi:hypothetical protein